MLTRKRATRPSICNNGRNGTRDITDPSFPHTFQEAPAIVSYPVKDIFLSCLVLSCLDLNLTPTTPKSQAGLQPQSGTCYHITACLHWIAVAVHIGTSQVKSNQANKSSMMDLCPRQPLQSHIASAHSHSTSALLTRHDLTRQTPAHPVETSVFLSTSLKPKCELANFLTSTRV